MHGVWKARPKEMGETRVRGEHAVIEADKVANWVRGTTEVSFDFRCLEGIRKVQASAAGALPIWRPRYGRVQEDCGGRLRWPYPGSSSTGGGSQALRAFTDSIREKATFYRYFVVAQNAELQ